MSEYATVELDDYDPDDNPIDGSTEDESLALETDDPDNECQCERAVKVKDGGQVCQVCGKDAYNSQYVFSHVDKGIELLRAAGKLHSAPPLTTTPSTASYPYCLCCGLDDCPGRLSELCGALCAQRTQDTAPALTPPVMPPVLPGSRTRKKAAPKAPKPRKVKPTRNPLLEAVEFIALAQRSKGEPMETHCSMAYGGLTAFDRTIAAGTLIRESDLMCLPNTEKLLLALTKCAVDDYKIVQLDSQLYISSGEFSAYVPCTTADKLQTAVPDPMIAPLTEAFREALSTVGKLIKDNGATMLQSAVQLNNASVIATNGQVILEVWHGVEFPPNRMLVPRRFCDMLKKTNKVIKGFGFSDKTFTVHFEDRSWLRTNLFLSKMEIDLLSKINAPATHKKSVPATFFNVVEDVAKWSENQKVYIFDNRISSHPKGAEKAGSNAIYALDGFTRNRVYSTLALKAISKFCTSLDDETVPGLTLFFGSMVRGAILHEEIVERPQTQQRPMAPIGWRYCHWCDQPSFNVDYCACCNQACVKYNVIFKVEPYDNDIPF